MIKFCWSIFLEALSVINVLENWQLQSEIFIQVLYLPIKTGS